MTIAEVKIHPSYAAKCKDDACAFGKIEASDAPDVAVLLLADDLATVPTIPVDLDAVGQADPLLAVTSGCSKADMTGTTVETAIRVLGRWQRDGLVHEVEGHLVLPDLEAVRESLAPVLARRRIELHADASIAPGGCTLSSAHASIDATLQARWSRVMGAIGRPDAPLGDS